jgi:hypothetical protein
MYYKEIFNFTLQDISVLKNKYETATIQETLVRWVNDKYGIDNVSIKVSINGRKVSILYLDNKEM